MSTTEVIREVLAEQGTTFRLDDIVDAVCKRLDKPDREKVKQSVRKELVTADDDGVRRYLAYRTAGTTKRRWTRVENLNREQLEAIVERYQRERAAIQVKLETYEDLLRELV